MTTQLERFKLQYEIVEAVDGHKLSRNEVSQLCDESVIQRDPNWFSPGMIGCTLSHRGLLERMIDEKIEKAIIMEDDIIIPSSFPDIIKNVTNLVQDNELFLLYWYSLHAKQPFSTINRIEVQPGVYISEALNPHILASTACYALTLETAKNIVSNNIPVKAVADDWKYHLQIGSFKRIKCLVPCIIEPALMRSDLVWGSMAFSKIKRFLEDNVPLVDYLVKKKRRTYWSKFFDYEFIEDM